MIDEIFLDIDMPIRHMQGKISSISGDATAYTYRTAVYSVQFGNEWNKKEESNKLISQTVKLDNDMAPYLSKPAVRRLD